MHMVASIGLVVKESWLGQGGSPPTRLHGKTLKTFHLVEGWFLARKAAWAVRGCSANYSLMNGCGQCHKQPPHACDCFERAMGGTRQPPPPPSRLVRKHYFHPVEG